MDGYDDDTYGSAFADVYDDWYGSVSDIDATVAAIAALAAPLADLPVLELGVGTGRLALPLAANGIQVVGVDSSRPMLDRMSAKPHAEAVRTIVGDMVDDLPDGPFAVVFVAYNTFFNLRSAERQSACMKAVAERLARGGSFVVEAFVPDTDEVAREQVSVRSLDTARVVLSVSRSDHTNQTAEGQYIDITEAGGVRLRPWSIRWATIAQLDAMAAAAGMVIAHRWEDFSRRPFDDTSARHVSVWQRP